MDKWYLLSITELLEEEVSTALWDKCLQWLDRERKLRVEEQKRKKRKAEGIGAGLLLQLAVMEAEEDEPNSTQLIKLTLSELLERLEKLGQSPLPLEYKYQANGKPYFKNLPYYFNLSHSDKYIFCALSDREVGVDIQWRKPLKDNKVWQRFFSEVEKKVLTECKSIQEREKLFYRLWAGKEAYGKLTGQGIGGVLDFNTLESGAYELELYEIEDYQIAVCKWKQEQKHL